MRRITALNLAFVMLLVSLPLISVGTVNNISSLWWIGLVVLMAGFIIPLLLRFITLRAEVIDEPDVGEEPS